MTKLSELRPGNDSIRVKYKYRYGHEREEIDAFFAGIAQTTTFEGDEPVEFLLLSIIGESHTRAIKLSDVEWVRKPIAKPYDEIEVAT